MPRRTLLHELQSFATEQGLPQPTIDQNLDGLHAFLYSRDQTKRYAYSLTWEQDQQHLLWIMLNPGTGETEGRRRATFERCKKWSRALGYGGLIFGNVFSLRSKSAKDLLKLSNPPDELNKRALIRLSSLAPETIVAWGNHGAKSDRPKSLQGVLSKPKCFGYTKAGQPRHPLYVADDTQLIPWTASTTASSEA